MQAPKHFGALILIVMASVARADTFYTGAGGLRYAFDVQSSTANYWNPEKDNNPRLSPNAALHIAEEYVKKIPVRVDSVWVAREVSLVRIGRERDQWVYKVLFWPGPVSEVAKWGGSFASFEVIVTLDGRTAKVTTEKTFNGKRTEPAANKTFNEKRAEPAANHSVERPAAH